MISSIVIAIAIATLVHTARTHAHAPVFDNNFANETILFAAAAYCLDFANPDWLNVSSCRACVEASTLVSDLTVMNGTDDLLGFVVVDHSRSTIVVSFRGTNPYDLWNWIVNIDALRTPYLPYPQALVHAGFYAAFNSMAPNSTLLTAKALAKYPTFDVLVTGHSLGCSLALFAFVQLLESDLIPAHTRLSFMGYGCPRVGNEVFVDYVANLTLARVPTPPVFRVVHFQDLVAHLPPQYTGFNHVPTEIFYDEPMAAYKVCNSTMGDDPQCSDGLWLKDSVSDHVVYYGLRVGSYCS